MRVNTVGVYWSARRESAETCSARLRKYLLSIEAAFPALSEWYKKGGSTSPAISVKQGSEDLLRLLIGGANRRDFGGEVMEDLGFRVSLWNKRKGSEAVSLGVTCGLSSNSAGLSNAVTLSLPQDLPALSLHGSEVPRKLLLLQVEAWNPDWGAAFASQGDAVKKRKGGGPFLDQLLWLRNGMSLPDGVTQEYLTEAALSGVIYAR